MSIIDYAGHLITIEELARATHDHAESRRYAEAVESALRMQAECKLLAHAITEMKNVDDTRFQARKEA